MPCLQDLARDPVVAADGCTYEREIVEGWVQHRNSTGPRRQHLHFKNRLYTTVVGMLLQAL